MRDQLVTETSTLQHITHTTDIPPSGGFEATISAGERPQTYALNRAATGTGNMQVAKLSISLFYTFLYLHIN